MERIRLLFLADCLRRGGSERQLASLLHCLFPSEEIEVLLLTRNSAREYDLPDDPCLKLCFPKHQLTKCEYFKLVRKTISQYRPHIVHAWEKTGATGAALCKMASRSSFVFLDGTSRFARTLRFSDKSLWTFKFNHALADVVVGNSRASLAAHGHTVENKGKYRVIPNGIDPGRIPMPPNGRVYPMDRIELVMIANFTPAKDHHTVIRSIAELISQGADIRMTFIGDGPLLQKTISSVPDRFSDSFSFTGKIHNVEQVLMRSSAGILLNSLGHAEGMSNAIMEYMTAALPVVCTDAGGNQEIVQHERNGYLVPYESTDDVILAIRKMLTDRDCIPTFGKESRRIIERDYTMNQMADKYLSLYKSLAF